jgi:hypothetical protein
MADKEEILLEIIVSNDKATQAIFESQQSIEKLKQSQISLAAEFKKGSLTSEEYSKKSTAVKVAISQQSEVIRLNEKELKNNIKSQKDNSDSLASLRAQLSNNVKAYDSLTKAERESAKGQELRDSIAATTDELKKAEEETGRFQRNVGNYKGLTNEAGAGLNRMTGFLGKMSSQVSAVSPQLGGIISQFGGFAAKAGSAASETNLMTESISQSGQALNAVEGFAGKATGSLNNMSSQAATAGQATGGAFSAITKGAVTMGKAFLSPPIIIVTAVILAIIGAVKLLSEGFKKNDEAGTKLSEAFAIFTPILDAIGSLFSTVAGAVADVILTMSKGIATIVDFTAGLFGIQTGLSAAAEEARNLVRAQDDLEQAEREYTVNSAKRNLEKAKLLAEAEDKNKNTAKQRIAFLKDALELDKQNLVDEKKISEEHLRIIEQTAKNENDTSDDTTNKIAEARAAALSAQEKYFNGTKEYIAKLNEAENQIRSEQKARFDEWKKNKDEQIEKEKTYLRQLEDLVIGQIKDDYQRQIEAEKAKTERENADLSKRLKTEENLTDTARKAINEIILLNNKNLIDKEAELIEKSLEENIKKEIEAKTKSFNAQIQLSEKNSIDELNIKQAKLLLLKDVELQNTELTNVERLAIEDKYNKDSQALTDSYLADKYDRISDNLEKELKLNKLKLDDYQASLQLQYEYDVKAHNRLLNLNEKEKEALFKSKQDYEIAVLESNKRIEESNSALQNQQINNTQALSEAYANLSAEIIKLLDQRIDDEISAHNDYLNKRKSQLDKEIEMINNKNITDEQKANQIQALKNRYNQEDRQITNEQNERIRKQQNYAKAIALSTILIKTAIAVAGAIASAQDAPYPYNLIAMASGVAAVLSGIASAKQVLSDDKSVEVPAYAKGGLISGRGTGTSDSIDARVSNGESIINANSTSMFAPLLSSLNVAGGGVGFGNQQINNQLQGEEMLARAFAAGASMLPPPVLSLKEFHSADDRLTAIKELG